MEFQLIPAGTFTMGEVSLEAKRLGGEAHEVTLTRPFKMGVHEVTQAQFEHVMGNNPSHFKGPDNPVEMVRWDDALEFCRRLSELPAEKAAGNVYRLPTEAEWEYACRAGTKTEYSFGDDAADFGVYGWCRENSGGTTHPVGLTQPNAWGLYDMHGNVLEFCQDSFRDPPVIRVLRGGGWYNNAASCRSMDRQAESPYSRTNNYGFRVVLISSGK